MVQQADLVIIGICVGLAAGILIASLAFFGIRWYKKRARLQQRENERSPSTLPIRRHGLNTSVDFSASLSSSVTNGPIEPIQKPQHSWWNNHTKDRFASVSGILRYSYKDIQKGTQNFTTILGQGSFGPVYKATMPAGEVVAVKVLASDSKQGEKEFQTEVSLLARLHHKNLVNLVGYCVDKGQHMLVYEFMSNGSLENLIYNDVEQALSWEDRIQIALDISHGIDYLHDGAVPPVIHRDLKSANILLDRNMRAKVADFGLSKEEHFDGRNSGLKGTYGYIDPMYISTNNFTTKSDVYSFGIILFELITAIHPHKNLMEYVNLASMSLDGVDDIIDAKMAETCNIEEVRSLAKIAHRCLHKTPRKRPSMGEVSQAIVKIKQQRRRLVKEDTMSFAGEDLSRAVSRIECQQLELRRMASIEERPNE
ncbi:calcium/calmodulin-regulated receptor-like kinase 2 [Salvia hispanica]|uniref:calcium/calmodulin-regulated receptor-like kinase 2 n=1 Tax=Salvia hispanica TaxID=49212 RepID=UPI002009538B|nr:calcium/calmodulin-regulated receptor-like kinase 2 [Salvia hispanica]XP_047960418.1 calcium/calmodulin-regulated receptor-like kinase 2 [Salvia hispanica]XP_047960419.1 calcium/calmodulin-regulated receptor-like kinase 2 [Salvia hispanica]